MKVGLSRSLPVILLMAACAISPAAIAEDAERIIVTNVRLAGREAAVQDVAVNILIVDGRLTVVTRDQLVIEPGDTAVDSNGGFLFGQLALGSRPSFVILNEDPRENADVLLDTKTYARFAVREGVIVKNELPAMAVPSAELEQKPRLWKAYTPPPIAVPIRYYDSRKWNKFETKPVSGLLIGCLLYTSDAADDSEAQTTDIPLFEFRDVTHLILALAVLAKPKLAIHHDRADEQSRYRSRLEFVPLSAVVVPNRHGNRWGRVGHPTTRFRCRVRRRDRYRLELILDDHPSPNCETRMSLGVQQCIDVLPWILVEDHEAGRSTQCQLSQQKTTARIHRGIARLNDKCVFRDDGQPAIDDQEIHGNILRRSATAGQVGVRDHDTLLSLIHISEPTRHTSQSRMPASG